MIALHLKDEHELIYVNPSRIDLITSDDSGGSDIVMQHVAVTVDESPEEIIRIINGQFN